MTTVSSVIITLIIASGAIILTVNSKSLEIVDLDFFRKIFELKFSVGYGKFECFSHDMKEGETLSLNFYVIQSKFNENLTIEFILYDVTDSNVLLHLVNRDGVNLEEFIGENRTFSLCFHNDNDFKNEKTIILYMSSYKLHNWDNIESELKALEVVSENFKTSFDNTEDQIEEAMRFFIQSRSRETGDLAIIESVYNYVNFWSIVHCLFIALVSVFQVLFVKTLFQMK